MSGDLWFPRVDGVLVEGVLVEAELVVLRVRAETVGVACPDCGSVSSRVHSRYVRRLADSAVGGRPAVIELRVRRFRCLDGSCPRVTFVEQVAGLSYRHGRQSVGLRAVLESVALMLAGRAGARLAGSLAVAASRSTMLRLIRALPDPVPSTPRVLGVDEFALRKGHVYATILVDIETRRPVDLLPDRTAATVAGWLAEHPGVEIICRDRSPAFAEAGRLGAPEAVHCADRWHIWHNLVEAVERTVVRNRALLREPPDEERAGTQSTLDTAKLTTAVPAEPRRSGRLSDRVRQQHAAVHALLGQGRGHRPIARELGLARNTVSRLANAATPDELLVGRWTGRTSILDPHKPYLHQRWQEGCTNGTRLFAELCELGYQGGTTVVRQYVRQLREAFPLADPPRRPTSVRDVTSWLTRHPDSLTEEQSQQLKAILARCPELDRTARHIRSFAELMNNRHGHRLIRWIADVRADDVPALHTFTAGLHQDLDAVTAGLTMPYSSGAVEGHNNRIKMLKRQMFGRANFDLLRKRVLLAA
ncbi:ISL3 family transposase [Kitasatospora sp. NPDC091207]|uniref:ISL3 family transposase n=1 Tax=Kitasatospora sp. NPDC091207 TaxID=3364083 RepID=UPI00380B378A